MTARRTLRSSMALVTALLALGCGDRPDEAGPGGGTTSAGLPPGHVSVSQSATAVTGQDPLIVTVMETMDSGGYTYARVENDGSEVWVAGPPAELEVGDVLMLANAMPMENFTSNSLNRTFDVLYFVGAYQKQGADAPVRAGAIDGVNGTVVQVIVGGGYTYVQVEVDTASLWLAGPMIAVSEGQQVSWTGGMTMRGFTSTTLDRTFDEILFVERITVRE